MTLGIATRTIHDPILFLRNTGDHRDDSLYLNVTRQLFNLDIPEEE
ncbi:MAG TPA: glutamyl-tRNA reductase, partial [Desulfobacterales bacterium]|nr:glutamyl-tRNA reductase [Desulfobacterales bacterium]